MRNISISKISVFIFSAIIIWLNFKYIPNNIISWDVFGYYLYLPSIFVYNDLSLNDLTALNLANEQYGMTPYYYQFYGLANGAHINIYQVGMALLYLPFFLIGHILAPILGYAQDGFSMPYQYSVWLGGMLYSFIGLLVLRKVLLCIFTEITTLIVLISIVLGTNYLLHSTLYASNLMTANFLFTLYAAFLLFTIRWHEEQKLKYIIGIAFFGGLMFLARPVELIGFLLPLLWNINNKADLKTRWELIKSKKWQFYVFFGVFLFLIFIQLFYNRFVSGDFFVSGYKSYGEDGFYLYDPHLFNVLFSFRKGWFIYTPIMLFAVIGIFQLRKHKNGIFVPLVIFIFLYLYAVSSWSNWWYAAGFSQRALIQIYPVLALSLAFFIQNLALKKWYLKILVSLVFIGFILLNLFQSWQYSVGILSDSRMTRAYYFDIFGQTSVTEEQKKLLIFDSWSIDEKAPVDSILHKKSKNYFNGFEQNNHQSDTVSSGKGSLFVNSVEYVEALKIPVNQVFKSEYAIIEISCQIMPLDTIAKDEIFIVAHLKHHRKAQKYRIYDLSEQELVPNKWNNILFRYITPEVKGRTDKLEIYFYNKGLRKFYIDNQNITVFERR